jgi:hypothetical protein
MYQVFFAQPISFLAVSHSSSTAISRLPHFFPSIAWDTRQEGHHRKHCFFYCCVLIYCCRDVLTAPLRSNARGADHRQHRSSIVARLHFRWNVFFEPLPSNEIFRLSTSWHNIKDKVRDIRYQVLNLMRLVQVSDHRQTRVEKIMHLLVL